MTAIKWEIEERDYPSGKRYALVFSTKEDSWVLKEWKKKPTEGTIESYVDLFKRSIQIYISLKEDKCTIREKE